MNANRNTKEMKIILALYFFIITLQNLSFNTCVVCIVCTIKQILKCHCKKLECQNHFPKESLDHDFPNAVKGSFKILHFVKKKLC